MWQVGSRCLEVLRKELELRCARWVIRHNSPDAWVLGDELLPKTIAVLALSDRWAAFVSSVTLLNLLGSQAEVVEAGLGSDVDSGLASGLEERDALGSGEVNDVEVELRSNVRLAENLLDSVSFESRRSRLEECLVGVELAGGSERCFWSLDRVADGLGDGRDHLGVEHESGLAVFESFHGQGDILGRNGGELINTRLDQESLESSNTSLDEREELIGIARDDTTVETNINPALALACPKLLFKAVKGGGGRNGVERHVNHSRYTTAGSSTGTSPEALPLSSTRLVQVDMSIDQTRNEKLGTVVDIVCASWETGWGEDFGDDGHDLSSDGADDDWSGSGNKGVIRKSNNDSGRNEDRKGTLGVLLSAGRCHDGWYEWYEVRERGEE
jgi:hypothetical protein